MIKFQKQKTIEKLEENLLVREMEDLKKKLEKENFEIKVKTVIVTLYLFTGI